MALDPRTGEILAMTSTPAYDPNEFTTGIDPMLWSMLANDPETPLMNRVIQGQYAPGSTFKIVMATAALEEGVISPSTTFYCPGHLRIYNRVFHCNVPGGHGIVDVRRALAMSCNVFFYQVGVRLEIDRIAAWAKRMGLGAPTGVDLPHEAAGLMPSPEWKRRVQKAPWYPGETVSVAIGQGQVSATPIQMARVAAVIANGGNLVTPHLVRSTRLRRGPRAGPGAAGHLARDAGDREGGHAPGGGGGHWLARAAAAGRGLRQDRVGPGGVEGRLERSPDDPSIRPHGWFVAFAPAEEPRIALAVLVEHAARLEPRAPPVARAILARFFSEESRRLAGAAATAAAAGAVASSPASVAEDPPTVVTAAAAEEAPDPESAPGESPAPTVEVRPRNQPKRPNPRPCPRRRRRRSGRREPDVMPFGVDRRLLYNVDWVLVGTAIVLSLVGVTMVFSATHSGTSSDLHLKQLALVGAGLVGARRGRGHRLPPAGGPGGSSLRPLRGVSGLRAPVRPGDRRHPPLDRDRRLPAPALRVREARGGGGRGPDVLRVPPGERWACGT